MIAGTSGPLGRRSLTFFPAMKSSRSPQLAIFTKVSAIDRGIIAYRQFINPPKYPSLNIVFILRWGNP